MDNIVFEDKNFVLTSLNFRNEEIITKLITKAGGKVRSSTVKDTDYIIYGATDSKKYIRATELKKQGRNIVFISEAEFVQWINGLLESNDKA